MTAATSVASWSKSSFASGSIPGNSDPVALFAFPVSTSSFDSSLSPTPHGVGFGVLMPTVAVSSVGLEVNSMSDEVEVVFGNCSVDEVFGSVIPLISIEMPGDLSLSPLSKEDHSDNVVNLEGFFPRVGVEDNNGIPLVILPRLEDDPFFALSAGQDFSSPVDPVIGEVWNSDPFGISNKFSICHNENIHSVNCLVKEDISDGR